MGGKGRGGGSKEEEGGGGSKEEEGGGRKSRRRRREWVVRNEQATNIVMCTNSAGSHAHREQGRSGNVQAYYLSSQGLAVKAYGLEVRAPTGQRSRENTNLVELLPSIEYLVLHVLTNDIS